MKTHKHLEDFYAPQRKAMDNEGTYFKKGHRHTRSERRIQRDMKRFNELAVEHSVKL